MQEFESISASSYDPSALATKLTAKAAEGWSVVAIVPTGGDVTAFISRDTNGVRSRRPRPKCRLKRPSHPCCRPPSRPPPSPSPSRHRKPSASHLAGRSPPSPPLRQPNQPPPRPSSSTRLPPTSPRRRTSPPPQQPRLLLRPRPPTPEPAPTPAVPAGWYADPAGRFELRYWDGSTWTEHVSRAGQQFTDPPVA